MNEKLEKNENQSGADVYVKFSSPLLILRNESCRLSDVPTTSSQDHTEAMSFPSPEVR